MVFCRSGSARERVAAARGRGADGSGTGRLAALRRTRRAAWQRSLAEARGAAIGTGEHASTARAGKEVKE